MKKITVTIILVFSVIVAIAQTIVGTTAENKNAILEEFTGIHCTYCPDGHTIANNIKASNPDDFYVINVHTGGYATPGDGEPDFRTAYGSALGSQSQLAGYPAGTVNRHYFNHSQSGSPLYATALGRGQWTNDSNTIIGQPSYVNVGVEASVDIATRELTIHVETYYTGDSSENTNFLNVALLQNHTTGPQTGGGAGDNYDHNHRLIDFITGQWGEEITTTTTGTFVDKTYTITLPVDYRGVWVDMSNLEVVAFVSETHQEIVTGSGGAVETTGTLLTNDAAVTAISLSKGNCELALSPEIQIYNAGVNSLTSLTVEYSLNEGETQTYSWSGNITSLRSEMISLPSSTITLNISNSITAAITETDESSSNNSFDLIYSDDEFLPETTEAVHVYIATDNWGHELTWEIKNSSDVVVASGGGDGTSGSTGSYGNNITVTETYTFPEDCYQLFVYDWYDQGGDGGNAVVIRTTNDENITFVAGAYGDGDDVSFKTSATASVEGIDFKEVVMYPNPTNGEVTFIAAKNVNISIFDVLGKNVFQTTILNNSENVDLSNLQSGIYLVNFTSENKKGVKKLIIQ